MPLTDAQRAFLDRPLHAILATRRADGTVVQSVAWYKREGDELWISTAPDSVKVRHLRRDPRLSMLVIGEDGGAYLALEGVATITEDIGTPERLELMRPYVGDEGARQLIARRPISRPNARIRLRIDRVTAYNVPE
jgi:PPOX class probable F420-dependent enzyme